MPSLRSSWLAFGALVWSCLLALPARAQEDTFTLDRLQVAGAPDDGFAVVRPYMLETTRFYGSATLGYALNALRAPTVTDDPVAESEIGNPVRHQLYTYLGAGVEIAGRLGFNLALPIAVLQSGADDPAVAGVGTGLDRGGAAGDLRLGARLVAYQSNDRRTRLGLGFDAFFATGSAVRFTSDGEATPYVYGTAEHDFGGFLLAGTLGPHFRPTRGISGPNGALIVGSEVRATVGVFLQARENLRLGAEVLGSTGLGDQELGALAANTTFSSRNTPFEWLASARFVPKSWKRAYLRAGAGTRFTSGYGAPDVRALAQIGYFFGLKDVQVDTRPPRVQGLIERPAPDVDTDGDGFPDDIDGCPTIKEDHKPPNPSDGCPFDNDRDKDGIPDATDKCPDQPEDKDGVEDEDGCPEEDADKDAILDVKDACPTVPGIEFDEPTRNGCPVQKHQKIVEEDGEIRLLEPIQFETAKSTIKEVSFPILDEVVAVLETRAKARLAVHGHTDNRGARAYNQRLSDERARAVLTYLVEHGIEQRRLESRGFGPDEPKESNDTEAGRSANRRVEFKILQDTAP